MQRYYRPWRVVLVLSAILAVIVVDHVRSPTFAANLGQGVATTLNQRDLTACAPCGAPCPSARP